MACQGTDADPPRRSRRHALACLDHVFEPLIANERKHLNELSSQEGHEHRGAASNRHGGTYRVLFLKNHVSNVGHDSCIVGCIVGCIDRRI